MLEARKPIKDHVVFTQLMFVRIIKKILSQPGSGKLYKGQPTRSSRKGEAPAAQTGTLRASWGIIGAINDQPDMINADIWQHGILAPGGGSPIKYGFYLEEGTRHMKARPHVQPAIEETQDWSDRNLDKVVREIVDAMNSLSNYDAESGAGK